MLSVALCADIVPDLRMEDFYDAAHRRIWQAIQDAAAAGRSIQAATIAAAVLPAETGGEDAVRVHDIEEMAVAKNNLEYYEDKCRAARTKRQALALAMEIQYRIQDAGLPAADLAAWIQSAAGDIGAYESAGKIDIASIAADMELKILERKTKPLELPGVRIGLPSVDSWTGGMKPGQLWIVAARPSVGKSALAHNIARSAATVQVPVTIASLEQSRAEVFMRLLGEYSGISGLHWESWCEGASEAKLAASCEHISKYTLKIIDRGIRTEGDIMRVARRLRPRIYIVDYLQLISGGHRGESRNYELGAVTKALKSWAMDAQSTVILLSQLNRQIEGRDDKKPRLSDLRDSGEIENDADVIIGLTRDIVAPPVKQNPCVIVMKNRNGPCGEFKAVYHPARCLWGEAF